jgi:hypothetical protein
MSDRRLSAKLVPTFVGRGCRVVSATDLGFLDPEPLLFFSSSSSLVLTRLSGPRSRPITSQKIWYSRESVARNSTTRPQRRSTVYITSWKFMYLIRFFNISLPTFRLFNNHFTWGFSHQHSAFGSRFCHPSCEFSPLKPRCENSNTRGYAE